MEIPNKYADFVNIFSPKLTTELPKHTSINNHAIELVDYWQPLYSSIYSLELMELEILKVYIKNNLVSGFIQLFKSPTRTLIFFDKKLDKSQRLYVDYWGFNNLTIKNWYFLYLVRESLNQLGRTWYFIKLDLTNDYY